MPVSTKMILHVQTSDISVSTISLLLEQMDGPASIGLVAVPTVLFFTDSEVNRSNRLLFSRTPL